MKIEGFGLLSVTAENLLEQWWLWLIAAIVLAFLLVAVIASMISRRGKEPEEKPMPDRMIIISSGRVESTNETAPQEPETAQEDENEDAADEQPAEPIEESGENIEEAEADGGEDEPEEEIPVVLPDESRTVLDKSFHARLSQSEDDLKSYYVRLKDCLLSFKGVKARQSWQSEAFNAGREKVAKLQIRGKAMYMYIALNAAELPAKYYAKDVSDKASYKSLPCMLKIKTERALKYAIELVELYMREKNIEQRAVKQGEYDIKYHTTQELIDGGYIKVKKSGD